MADINDKHISYIEIARSITSPDYSEMSFVLLDKFQSLCPENQRLCLAFMNMLKNGFNG